MWFFKNFTSQNQSNEQQSLEKQQHSELLNRFPYALLLDNKNYLWVFNLLKKKYSLQNPGQTIRYLNKKLYFGENLIPQDVSEDIDIEKYEKIEVEIRLKQWKNQDQILKQIEFLGDDGTSFKIEVPNDIKVRELKQIILSTRNKPFFFDFNMNDSTVQDLIDKSLKDQINITFNYKNFNLFITDDFGDSHFIVKGLTQNDNFIKILKNVSDQLQKQGKNYGLNENDISKQLWFRKKESREIIQVKDSLSQLKIQRYSELCYAFPKSHKNGLLYVDLILLQKTNERIFRFQINQNNILFKDLLKLIQEEKSFQNYKEFQFYRKNNFQKISDLDEIINSQDNIIADKENLMQNQEFQTSSIQQECCSVQNAQEFSIYIKSFKDIEIKIQVPKLKQEFTIKIGKSDKLEDLLQQICIEIEIEIKFLVLKCGISKNILQSDFNLFKQLKIDKNNRGIIIVEIIDKVYVNFMNQVIYDFHYDENTTFKQMIKMIPDEYFKEVKQEDLIDVKSNNVLITFQGDIVEMDELIKKYNRGDRFLIQYKLNFKKKGDEYVTRDNISYLEMMYFVYQQQIKQNQFDKSDASLSSTQSSSYQVKDELKSLFQSTQSSSEILDSLYDMQDENNYDFLTSLIKTYTCDEFYTEIGKVIRQNHFHKLKCYLSSIFNLQTQHGEEIQYKIEDASCPVFRGTRYLDFKDYQENDIHYWPLFTSTSKDINVTDQFGQFKFEIYLTKQNSPPSNIEIQKKHSKFDEKEVLLLPQFQFIVLKNDLKKKVTIVEVPFQNLLKLRKISYCRVIWIDNNVYNDENQQYYELYKHQFQDIGLVLSDNIEEGIRLINDTVKAVVITSGGLGQALLPKIQFFKNLMGVLVFCFNVEYHKTWTQKYEKVKGVTADLEQALEISDNLLKNTLNNDQLLKTNIQYQ